MIKKEFRDPTNIAVFSLFHDLADVATKKSDGKGFPDGTQCPITEKELTQALLSQKIQPADLPTAINHCISTNLFTKEKDGTYRATKNGLATYHMRRRRI